MAEIVPGSLTREFDSDGELKQAFGKLSIAGAEGSFHYSAGEYRVELVRPLQDPRMHGHELALGFHEGDWTDRQGWGAIDFMPRTKEPASRHLAPDEEAYVGWALEMDPLTGVAARPSTMRAQGDAWRIGNSESLLPRDYPWLRSTAPFDAWLAKLAPAIDGGR